MSTHIAVAERELRLADGRAVRIAIGCPRSEAGGATCRFQIQGLQSPVDMEASQVDTLGALIYAIDMAATALHRSEEGKKGLLEWPFDPRPDLGLPEAPDLFDGDP